jgi:hypothetical protein
MILMLNLLRMALMGVFIPILTAAPADNQLTAAEKAEGWRLLFDGKTFNGWVDPTKQSPRGDSFVIDGGCLKSVSHAKIEEDLFSQATFQDFELEFDWKIAPRGNSGVKYRIQDHLFLNDEDTKNFPKRVNDSMKNRRTDRPAKGQDYVIGFEYQITDNGANSDALANGPMHRTAALYDVVAASKDVTRPVGEFNHSRLVVKGDHVEHWLNGEKVLDTSLKSPAVANSMGKRWGETSPVYQLLVQQPKVSCPISLQNHGDEAWFKNLKIRPL